MNLSSFSKISATAFANPLVKANIEILPDYPFSVVAKRIAELFNLRSLERTDRFDEVPAVCGVFDRHEIILFDIPERESEEMQMPWNYALEVYPLARIADGEAEDISPMLCSCIESSGLRCESSR